MPVLVISSTAFCGTKLLREIASRRCRKRCQALPVPCTKIETQKKKLRKQSIAFLRIGWCKCSSWVSDNRKLFPASTWGAHSPPKKGCPISGTFYCSPTCAGQNDVPLGNVCNARLVNLVEVIQSKVGCTVKSFQSYHEAFRGTPIKVYLGLSRKWACFKGEPSIGGFLLASFQTTPQLAFAKTE